MKRNEFGWQTWQIVAAVVLVGLAMGGLAFGVGRALGFWWGSGAMLAEVSGLAVWSSMTADRVLVLGAWRGVWLCPGWYLGPWGGVQGGGLLRVIGPLWRVVSDCRRGDCLDASSNGRCAVCRKVLPPPGVISWRWCLSGNREVCSSCFYGAEVAKREPVSAAKQRGACALCQRPLGHCVVLRWIEGDLREICMECSYYTSPVSYTPRREAVDSGGATNGTNDTKGKTVPDMPGTAPLPPPEPVRCCGTCWYWDKHHGGKCCAPAVFPDAAYSCAPGMRREMRGTDGGRCPLWELPLEDDDGMLPKDLSACALSLPKGLSRVDDLEDAVRKAIEIIGLPNLPLVRLSRVFSVLSRALKGGAGA